MIGIDLVYVPEFARNLEAGGEPFLTRVFLPSELSNRKVEHLSGIFAAKEAVIKAMRLPIGCWHSIEITGETQQRACINPLEFNSKNPVLGERYAEISISHHGEYAVAVALKTDG